MPKLTTVMVLSVFVVAIGLWGYSRELQYLANEGQVLFDARCNEVNPPLIAYKNAYIEWMQMFKEPEKYSQEQFIDRMNAYLNGMNTYLPRETEWLGKQSEYVNRWDFQLFQPAYMKDLSRKQLAMYESYKYQAQQIVKTLSYADGTGRTELPDDVDRTAAKKMLDASDQYFAAYDEASANRHWTMRLWKNPPSNCPDENLDIPDTSIDAIFEPIVAPEIDLPLSPRS